MTAVVNSKRYPREWGEVQGLEGLRAVDPVVSIQRRPCCSLELPSTWSGAVAPLHVFCLNGRRQGLENGAHVLLALGTG